jgi:hypothetical protein
VTQSSLSTLENVRVKKRHLISAAHGAMLSIARLGAAIIAELAAMASGVRDQIQDTGRIVDRRLSPASCTEYPS